MLADFAELQQLRGDDLVWMDNTQRLKTRILLTDTDVILAAII